MAKKNDGPKHVERGSGICVQVEICKETHERLKLEGLRLRRNGWPGTNEAILLGIIEAAKESWPRLEERG